jgi:HPt (histidine-containing phosphotransfer) domain-containing protein
MNTQYFDWIRTVEKLRGNETVAKEIVATFFKELPKIHKAINEAYKQKNLSTLYEYLHKLHGSCCFVIAPELKEITQTFCRALKSQSEENYLDLLNAFNLAVDRLMEFRKNASSKTG